MIKVGIDCESLNKSRWGIARIVFKLLEEYSKNEEWHNKYKLFLYFQTKVPSDTLLRNPLFTIRMLKPVIKDSFNIYYHILMPISALRDRLDWMFFPSYMLPPIYFKKSIVLLTGDVHRKNTKGTLPLRYRIAYELFSRWASVAATKILTISNSSKFDVINLFGTNSSKIFVAYLGVEMLPSFAKASDGRQTNDKYLLFVGQALPRRRLKESLLAFEKIAIEFSDINFIAIGTDKYNPPIINSLIHRINIKLGKERIMHYDYIEDENELSALYRDSFLFIYVSTSEAFGLPPVEAASHGTPVIVKDNQLNHELFEDAAFFVKDETSPDSIAGAMRKGLLDYEKRNNCIEKYKTIVPRYTWHKFAINFFNEIKK